jgi:hypothetical protein
MVLTHRLMGCTFRFFRHTKYTSFQRQLNIYDFNRITYGADQHAYSNKYFLRNEPEMIVQIKRNATKGYGGSRHDTSQNYPSASLKNSDNPRAAAVSLSEKRTSHMNMSDIYSNLSSAKSMQDLLPINQPSNMIPDVVLHESTVNPMPRVIEDMTNTNFSVLMNSQQLISRLQQQLLLSRCHANGNNVINRDWDQVLSLPSLLLNNALTTKQNVFVPISDSVHAIRSITSTMNQLQHPTYSDVLGYNSNITHAIDRRNNLSSLQPAISVSRSSYDLRPSARLLGSETDDLTSSLISELSNLQRLTVNETLHNLQYPTIPNIGTIERSGDSNVQRNQIILAQLKAIYENGGRVGDIKYG